MFRKSVTLPVSMWLDVAAFRQVEQIGSEMETLRRLIRAGLLVTKKSQTPPA